MHERSLRTNCSKIRHCSISWSNFCFLQCWKTSLCVRKPFVMTGLRLVGQMEVPSVSTLSYWALLGKIMFEQLFSLFVHIFLLDVRVSAEALIILDKVTECFQNLVLVCARWVRLRSHRLCQGPVHGRKFSQEELVSSLWYMKVGCNL